MFRKTLCADLSATAEVEALAGASALLPLPLAPTMYQDQLAASEKDAQM